MKQELERIYSVHRQGLFSLALSITGSPAKAEDAVHEAFSRLLQSGKLPDGDPVPYTFASVRNASYDIRRRETLVRNKAAELPTLTARQPQDSPLASAQASEEHDRLKQAVEGLPIAQKETVVMHIFSGLTFAQIAQSLGEPLQTVASRYRRALQALKEALESEHERTP